MRYNNRPKTKWLPKALTMCLIISLPNTSLAQSPNSSGCYPNPQPLVDACRAAIKAHDKSVADANAALTKQIEVTNNAVKDLAADDAKLASWTHNPAYLTALGFLVGVLATGYAIKH